MARRDRTSSRFRPLAQIGLRARITITFTMGALLVAVLLILTSVVISRRNLLDQREQLATERARINAILVRDKVGSPDTDAQTVFGSLSTAGKPSVWVRAPGGQGYRPISFDTRYGAALIPTSLRDLVLAHRQAGVMRFDADNKPVLAVGIPIPGQDGGYFEISPLADISDSIAQLSRTLIVAAGIAAIIGAALGWWAARRVLRPLADISHVAELISVGKLDARLAYSEWADDVDLAPLVSSFNEMVSALQARIDRDARFASDVSHELRSPLTTFNASLEVLRNARDELPERAQIALDLLSSDMERFTQLVEDLLEISRFDAGAVRLELDEVLVVESVEMAIRTLTTAPITVVADPRLEGVIITCDKRRLVRILANFIDNAAKYGEGADLVTVDRVEPVAVDEPDDPDAPPATPTVRIGVENRGPGVPESERERIFDRFYRGDQGGSRGNSLGVGLGLALAAEHARLQGGAVWVEDRTDGEPGARFVVELPLVEPLDETHPTHPADTGETDAPGLDEVLPTGEHQAISVEGWSAEIIDTSAGSPNP